MESGRKRSFPRVPRAHDRARHVGLSTVILLAPAGLLFATFVLYPIVASIRLSLYDWDGVGAMRFVGLGNYRELMADPAFHTALANNLRWLGCYLLAPVAGLALALLLQRAVFGMGLVRSLFFMPFVDQPGRRRPRVRLVLPHALRAAQPHPDTDSDCRRQRRSTARHGRSTR